MHMCRERDENKKEKVCQCVFVMNCMIVGREFLPPFSVPSDRWRKLGVWLFSAKREGAQVQGLNDGTGIKPDCAATECRACFFFVFFFLKAFCSLDLKELMSQE